MHRILFQSPHWLGRFGKVVPSLSWRYSYHNKSNNNAAIKCLYSSYTTTTRGGGSNHHDRQTNTTSKTIPVITNTRNMKKQGFPKDEENKTSTTTDDHKSSNDKKEQQSNTLDSTPTSSAPFNTTTGSTTAGTFKRTLRPTETRDGAGQVILQTNNSGASPKLNAAVWLDTTRYIKQSSDSSTSRSGTEGARRLLRGRAAWTAAVRKHVQRGHGQQQSTQYQLESHGVPPQLLQDHVNYWHKQYRDVRHLAEQMQQEGAAALVDPSLAVWELHATSSGAATVTEPRHVQRALVRRVTSDKNTTTITHRLPITSFPSPFDDDADKEIDESPDMIALQLYLTVMHRLASTLSVVLEEDEEHGDNDPKQLPTSGIVTRWHIVVAPDTGTTTTSAKDTEKSNAPRLTVSWYARQVCVHLYGQSDTVDNDNDGGKPLHILYHGQIQRPKV